MTFLSNAQKHYRQKYKRNSPGPNNCDQVWENRSKSHILYFKKYLFEIFNTPSFSCGTIQSRQMCYINSVVIWLAFYSYFYKLLECCCFFNGFFSAPVISWIDSIGGGRVGGGGVGGGGGWGAVAGVKHPFGLKEQSCAFSK